MATRTEIREGIKGLLKEYDDCGYVTFDCECSECIADRDKLVDGLFRYLHSQGVAIKVENKQPTTGGGVTIDGKRVPQKTVQCVEEGYFVKMVDAGYTLTEPIGGE